MDIEKIISGFMKQQAEDQRAARKKERRQVCINPNSYIGKEIQYQTALLHEILAELRKSNGGYSFGGGVPEPKHSIPISCPPKN